ncbi:copper amine oxidase N-terminal domain-containing protein [Paenibacillus sp. CF384]|uniref:copper amine oxidase N-terminal domain-containing protein n=1 Tax=Paenibacillus sp. CF384 TaxID=1884382 RepID=UPI000896D3A0|nr:copper amine oxidase N-terminal domain-containing protein [Paenibacillus sp. CF384]SDW82304.1 Copper amine oxidase N-terminal domain-containing protein [Paenibacillus sp. CF384]
MKKKLLVATLALSMALPLGVVNAAVPKMLKADMPIEVLYNARKIAFDVKPKMVDGTVLIPVRYVSEKLQATVAQQGNTILVSKGSKTIKLTIESKVAEINGKSVALPQPAIVEQGRTLVPIRVISEGLGVAVEWDSELRFVWIGSKEVPELNDIISPVNIKPYLAYFKGGEYLLDDGLGDYTKASIVRNEDFPFKVGVVTYFKLDLAYDSSENVYLRTVIKTNFERGSDCFYLKKNTVPKKGVSLNYLREHVSKGIHINFNDVSALGNSKIFKENKVEYIGIRTSNRLKDGTGSVILIDNPWR